MITTGLEEIAKAFSVTTDQVSFNLVGLLQLTTGSGTFFTAAAAAVWGKRPVFLISTLFLFGTSAWGFFAGVCPAASDHELQLTSFVELPFLNDNASHPGFCCSPSGNTYQCYCI
jgi:hypothetical protein